MWIVDSVCILLFHVNCGLCVSCCWHPCELWTLCVSCCWHPCELWTLCVSWCKIPSRCPWILILLSFVIKLVNLLLVFSVSILSQWMVRGKEVMGRGVTAATSTTTLLTLPGTRQAQHPNNSSTIQYASSARLRTRQFKSVWRIRIILFWYWSGSRMCKNLLRIRIQGEFWYGFGSGSRQKRYGSGSSKKGLSTRKIFKKWWKTLILIIQISVKKLKLFYVFNGFSWIRIRIIWYVSGFRIQPFFNPDPDPGKWYGFHGSGSATLI